VENNDTLQRASNITKSRTAFEIKALEEDGTFIGLGSVFGNIDLHDDIVVRGAFEKTISEKNEIPILWQHNPTQPIGKAVIEETFDGLMVHGRLTLGAAKAREALALMRDGVTTGLSIGYDVVDSEMGQDGIRHLKELKLWEVSVVTFPANTEARLLQVKSVLPFQDLALADRTMPWNEEEAKGLVRAWSRSESGPNEDYLKGFLYQDDSQPEVFASAKFQIATVIDGRLAAVPEAIISTAKFIHSAKDSDIPGGDVAKVKAHLTRYYRKMRSAFGDDTMRAPWEGQASMSDHNGVTLDVMLAQIVSASSLKMMDVKTAAVTGGDPVVSETDLVRLTSARDALDALISVATVEKDGGEATEDGSDEGGEEGKDDEGGEETVLDGEIGGADADGDDDSEDKSKSKSDGSSDDGTEDSSSDAPGSAQGDEDEKSYIYDGEPIELSDADLKSLSEWSGQAVKVIDTKSSDEEEIDPDLYADMAAFANTLTVEPTDG
jgi:HK97 family phage prohead protease